MATQKDLETLLHLSQVKDSYKNFQDTRIKGKIGSGPTTLYDTDFKEILAQMIFGERGGFDGYNSDGVASFVNNYLVIAPNKAEDSPGRKAYEEFENHKDTIFSNYIIKTNEIITGLSESLKEKGEEDKNVVIYELIGTELQMLAQYIDHVKVREIAKGNDEEQGILSTLTRDSSFYEDLSNNKQAAARELGRQYGVRQGLFQISDTYASNFGLLQKSLDIRKAGKYFLTKSNELDKNKVEKFFGDSPYAIAKMAEKLPKQ